MAFLPVPQDEQVYDNPSILPGLPGGTLNSDSILWYFMNSPFFDRQSNNTALVNQLHGRPEGAAILVNRRAFEDRLAKFPTGTSYVCVAEPQGPGQPYVLQRQHKRIDAATGRTVTEVQATYYTQGTKVFVAPSLLDVLQARLLTTATKLQDAYQLAKDLNHFAPGTGHSYLPPAYELPKTAAATSRIGSPSLAPSAEPTSQTQDPSQPAKQTQTLAHRPATAATTDANPAETPDAYSDALFMQSYALADTYFYEYADENPLQGEPGAFVYSSTHAAVQQRNQQQEKERQQKATQIAAAPASNANANASTSGTGTGPANLPTAIKTEAPPSGPPSLAATPAAPDATSAVPHSRKGSVAGMPKVKRKKSKGLGTTPVTPTAPPF